MAFDVVRKDPLLRRGLTGGLRDISFQLPFQGPNFLFDFHQSKLAGLIEFGP
jgi:hypothetical protein